MTGSRLCVKENHDNRHIASISRGEDKQIAAAALIAGLLFLAALAWGVRSHLALRRQRRSRGAEDSLRSEIRRTVLSSLNQEFILSHITSLLHDKLGFQRVWLGVIEGERLEGRMARGSDLPRDFVHRSLPLEPSEPNPWCDTAREGRAVVFSPGDDPSYKSFLEITGNAPFASVPVSLRDRTVGVIYVDSGGRDRPLPGGSAALLSDLAQELAIALENARLYEREQDFAAELKKEVNRVTGNLNQAQESLVRAERLAATGNLAAQIAHEINNPLGGIKNYLYILSQKLRDDPASAGTVETLTTEVDRIARIVRQLLDFYRPSSEDLLPADLNRVVTEALALVEKDLESDGIDLEINLTPGLPKGLVSAEQIKQVILNLVLNARDSMPAGGRLSVSTAESERNDRAWLEIKVADTGPGIAPEIMPRLFEPFFSSKTEGAGTGLGLSVSHGIVERHKGLLLAANRPGPDGPEGQRAGAEFTILLPPAPAADQESGK